VQLANGQRDKVQALLLRLSVAWVFGITVAIGCSDDLVCTSAFITHSLRVELNELSECPDESRISLSSEHVNFECVLSDLRLGRGCMKSPRFGTLVLDQDADVLLVHSVDRIDLATLVVHGDAGACTWSGEFVPKHEKDGEPNGPGCGFRYRGTATVNIEK